MSPELEQSFILLKEILLLTTTYWELVLAYAKYLSPHPLIDSNSCINSQWKYTLKHLMILSSFHLKEVMGPEA